MKSANRIKAIAGIVGVATAVIVFHTGLNIIGTFVPGQQGLIPEPRDHNSFMLGITVVFVSMGLAMVSARMLGDALGETFFPELMRAEEVWEELSPELRRAVAETASRGYEKMALKGDLLREAMHLGDDQRHLRFVSRSGGVVSVSKALGRIAQRHPVAVRPGSGLQQPATSAPSAES